jgi:drug/metabolite transporter (DMT)-like permease
MEVWIPITIAAAFVQNLRFMLQNHLKGALSTLGVTFARFIFAAPLAVLFLVILVGGDLGQIPGLTRESLFFAFLGGVTQILATAVLIALFSRRNFIVGVSFSKTETIQTALVGLVLLGEQVSALALIAIVMSMIGVLLLSVEPGKLRGARVLNRAAGLGLLSGALFGVSAVSYRAASLALVGGDFLERAALTLAVVTVFQTVVMWIWLAWREPGEVGRVVAKWRITGLVGVTGMLGSLGWFAAMTLQNAAYVRALGQVELVFALVASWAVFRETILRRELIGVALLVLGIIWLLLSA